MKCISIILILSFLYYCLGCSSTRVLKNEKELRYSLEKYEHIYVKTRNGITYFYETNTCKFENDTLYVEGQKIIERDKKKEPESVKIAYIDIVQIEIKNIDTARSIFFVVIMGSIIAMIIIIPNTMNFGPMIVIKK